MKMGKMGFDFAKTSLEQIQISIVIHRMWLAHTLSTFALGRRSLAVTRINFAHVKMWLVLTQRDAALGRNGLAVTRINLAHVKVWLAITFMSLAVSRRSIAVSFGGAAGVWGSFAVGCLDTFLVPLGITRQPLDFSYAKGLCLVVCIEFVWNY